MNGTMKICGNSLTRQVKRAIYADTTANAKKKAAKRAALLSGTGFSFSAGTSVADIYADKPVLATIYGLASACFGGSLVKNLIDFTKAVKINRQTSQKLKELINNENFIEIINRKNRYLRMNSKKEVTIEEIMEKWKN